MKQYDHVEESFSEFFDGSLEKPEHDSVQAHLAECSACQKGYLEFKRSTDALRAMRLAPTSAAYVRDVTAAVVPTVALRRSPLTLLVPLLSHAAVLLLGLGIAWLLWGGERVTGQANKGEGQDLIAEVREVFVEVPVEVPVEVRVEVPVEVVREIPIERIVYIDRPVANPVQLETERGLRLLAAFGGALTELARVAGEESERRGAPVFDPMSDEVLAQNAEELPLAQTNPRSREQQPDPLTPLRILRTGDSIRIQTRGALGDVVPALIDTLFDPDTAVVRAAEHHLEALRVELEGDGAGPGPNSRPRVPAANRPGGLRGLLGANRSQVDVEADDLALVDPSERWTSWWNGRATDGEFGNSF